MTSPINKTLNEQFAALSVNESSQEGAQLAQKVSDLLLRPDAKVEKKLAGFSQEVQLKVHELHKEAKKLLLDMAMTRLQPQTDEMVLNAKAEELVRTVCNNEAHLIKRIKDLTAAQKIGVLTAAAPLMAECRSVDMQVEVLQIVRAIHPDARDQSLQHYPKILRSFTDDATKMHFLESLVSIMSKCAQAGLVVEGLGNVVLQTPHICWGKYTFKYEANPVSWLKSLETAVPFLQNRRFGEEY
ncbi:MAG: hypothetical protein LLF94_09085, partial [Chlamydiales bacterium]|nr:hypothetical protein [Chlamydiales bacterium]